jgi:hypothetical protein
MKPAPSTASRSISRAVEGGLGTPGSFFNALLAKNRNTSWRETSVAAISPKWRASSVNPSPLPPAE